MVNILGPVLDGKPTSSIQEIDQAELVLSARSMQSQGVGVQLNTDFVLTYELVDSVNAEYIQVDPSFQIFTFLKDGLYFFDLSHEYERTSSAQSSIILTKTEARANSGASWEDSGVTRRKELDGTSESGGEDRSGIFYVSTPGVEFRGAAVKDAGPVDIALRPYTPATPNWAPVPSTRLDIYKLFV